MTTGDHSREEYRAVRRDDAMQEATGILCIPNGLVEAADARKNACGSGRLCTLLAANSNSGPQELVTKIIGDIRTCARLR